MAFMLAPSPLKTEPYYKTKYICTNANCRRVTWRSAPVRAKCPECFAPMESDSVHLVIPKEMVCHYCKRSDCPCLMRMIENAGQ